METKQLLQSQEIDFGKVLIKVLELIIVKPFTLPLKIYKNALAHLSNADADDSEESVLSSDFPLYTWFISIFDAIIVIIYPVGLIIAIIAGTNSFTGGFGSFLSVLVITYFAPLIYGLIRELFQISLKGLLYLKIISKK
ncbi:hypothetical protein MWU78_18420 [Arenibacter sp. F26102]|uniref:hypothetical protein n=1 Tax=Arenibacter sp. F26102 TaxID=2926416 RepID=UPI001FF2A705|nr:hypothetical protein [Arenibacter sp. F26102]MCK0147636.1 hypothetical protein [Arenibacter sp. F26102]